MKTLDQSQILGVAIQRVRHDYRPRGEAGWLDTSRTYFTLASGVSFVIPSSGSDAVESADVPSRAKHLDTTPPLVGRHVVLVHRRWYDGEPSAELCLLELDDGLLVTETGMAPHGTGAAGLYVYPAAERAQLVGDGWELTPFWSSGSPR